MTLRHLKILKTVAETGNFTKAANKLYITQSAVSHAIKELEESTRTALFDRLSKSVKLTESGRLLLEESLPILALFEELEGKMNALEKQAPIHIVASITLATFWLPEALQKFKEKWPDITVEVQVVSAAHAMEILYSGEADLALIEGTIPKGPFICTPFDSYHLEAVCAPGYFPQGTTLTLEELCSQRLLLREKGSAIRDALDSLLYLSGHRTYPVWTSVNSQALIEAAKSGLGITVLPTILIEKIIKQGELVRVLVNDFELSNQMLSVVHRDKYQTKALSDLLEIIHN